MSADFVLDTGALVALQRDPRRFIALVMLAREESRALRTSAPVVTEFLGGSSRRLRPAGQYVISRISSSDVTESLARRAAVLIQGAVDEGGRARPSAIDALVAAEAEATDAALVFDGDEADFRALSRASGALEIQELRGLL